MDTTTGGLDIIVKIIKQKHPHMKTGQIYMIIDVAILIASAIAFNNVEVALLQQLQFMFLHWQWIRQFTLVTKQHLFI